MKINNTRGGKKRVKIGITGIIQLHMTEVKKKKKGRESMINKKEKK